jgi:hypothetical protein
MVWALYASCVAYNNTIGRHVQCCLVGSKYLVPTISAILVIYQVHVCLGGTRFLIGREFKQWVVSLIYRYAYCQQMAHLWSRSPVPVCWPWGDVVRKEKVLFLILLYLILNWISVIWWNRYHISLHFMDLVGVAIKPVGCQNYWITSLHGKVVSCRILHPPPCVQLCGREKRHHLKVM